jgi:hypothetical protein
MKKIILVLALIITAIKGNGQNYTVGIEVDNIISTLPFNDNFQCNPDATAQLVLPYSSVTGIEHILIVNSSQGSVVTADPGGILNEIDTLQITSSQNLFTFYLSFGGSFSCILKAIGTPQIANETYGCTPIGWNSIGNFCPQVAAFFWSNQCTVSATTAIQENNIAELNIFPNPATSTLTIQFAAGSGQYAATIRNAQGQLVKSSIFNIQRSTFDISQLSNGIYFLTLDNGEQTVSKKFVKQ